MSRMGIQDVPSLPGFLQRLAQTVLSTSGFHPVSNNHLRKPGFGLGLRNCKTVRLQRHAMSAMFYGAVGLWLYGSMSSMYFVGSVGSA